MPPFNHETTAEEVCDAFADRIKGRIFLITGPSATSIGGYMATSLARKGSAHLILVGRNKVKVDPVLSKIATIDPQVKATFVRCDLTVLDTVRDAAARIGEAVDHINGIINNAAIMYVREYTLDKQGRELQLSTYHIGHFLLTNLLVPKILASPGRPGAHVTIVSSIGHIISPFRFDDWNFSGGATYDGWTAYGQAKTAEILYGVELGRSLEKKDVTVLSVHPGGVRDPALGSHLDRSRDLDALGPVTLRNTGRAFSLDPYWKTVSQGAASPLAAMLDPGLLPATVSGSYYKDCHPANDQARDYALDGENARRLWALSEEWVGQRFDF